MKKLLTILLIVVGVLYVASPIDGFPGPLDDILVVVLEIIVIRIRTRKKKSRNKE